MAIRLLPILVIATFHTAASQTTAAGTHCSAQDLLEQQLIDIRVLLHRQMLILEQLQANAVGPRDCAEIYESGECLDGVYTVYVGSTRRPVQVYCDMTTDGGGWLVFQRRQDGSVDFYRNWANYSAGFGSPSGEFWLGNNNLHALTAAKRYELRVDLGDFEGNTRYAVYDNFKVESACEKFLLSSIGNYSGTAGDSLGVHARHMFSTWDQDNDGRAPTACAVTHKGAWWYSSCHDSNLNGRYLRGDHTSDADGVNWKHWKDYHYSLKFTEMKIRPYKA